MWPPRSRHALSTSNFASSLSANGHSKRPSHPLSAGCSAKRKDFPGPVEMTAPSRYMQAWQKTKQAANVARRSLPCVRSST
eukprot:13978469-Alexandrium_andersonii.AAC.1